MEKNYTVRRDIIDSIVTDRGYKSDLEFRRDLMKLSRINVQRWDKRLEPTVKSETLSINDVVLIARLLEMTPREFCDSFFNGLFIQNGAGKVTAEPLIEEREAIEQPPKTARERRQKQIEELFNERVEWN